MSHIHPRIRGSWPVGRRKRETKAKSAGRTRRDRIVPVCLREQRSVDDDADNIIALKFTNKRPRDR